ncbi:MAG: hypothetical protein INF81_16460 [Roseomonas sp.]|nr:hypothetical protein [Roseomonas sp.]MCA3428109.1 hypothetical protein [Roseomonas sp.]MCA3433583.1 hypothetical protein [Roseomonas sp.]
MMRRYFLGASMGLALAAPAIAQGLPDRPITLVSGFAPGGSTDITARLLAERMQAHMGGNARVVVEKPPRRFRDCRGRVAASPARRWHGADVE